MNENLILKYYNHNKNNYEIYKAIKDSEYKSNGYYYISYLLPCKDYRENVDIKANFIKITIYYTSNSYELYLEPFNKENNVSRCANGQVFKYIHKDETLRLSYKKIKDLIQILEINFKSFINAFLEINKNIKI